MAGDVPGTDLVSEMRVKVDDDQWRIVAYSYDGQGRLLEETRRLGDGKEAVR